MHQWRSGLFISCIAGLFLNKEKFFSAGKKIVTTSVRPKDQIDSSKNQPKCSWIYGEKVQFVKLVKTIWIFLHFLNSLSSKAKLSNRQTFTVQWFSWKDKLIFNRCMYPNTKVISTSNANWFIPSNTCA